MPACTMQKRIHAHARIGANRVGRLLHGAIKVLPPSPSIRMCEHKLVRAKAGVEVVDSETCEEDHTEFPHPIDSSRDSAWRGGYG